MAVQLATLDLLTEKSRFDPEAARAIGNAITMEISSALKQLATQQDVTSIRSDIAAVALSLRHEMSLLAIELRTDLKQDFARTLVSSSELKADLVQWTFAAMIGQAALILGITYFMLQQLR